MCFKIKILVLFSFFVLNVKSFEDFNGTVAEEIQHAICKIATEDIEATANATIRRELKGVCTSKELMERFDKLERKLFNILEVIKRQLQIEDTNSKYPEPKLFQITEKNSKIGKTKVQGDATKPYARHIEALKNNGTIQKTELGRSSLYFWRIYDVNNILKNSIDKISSGLFLVQGNAFQILLHLRHLGTRYVALELTTNGYYLPQHRFVILNQNYERNDLSSQVLDNSVSLFRVSLEKIYKEFVANDTLFVKAIVSLY